MNKTIIKIFYSLAVAGLCLSINASNNDSSMTGYWLTSQSIVHVKECENSLCAVIEHIFVENGIDPESILDKNNKDKSMRERSLIGINLIDNFSYISGAKELSGGKIYDPGRGRSFKSSLYLLENGNLKVEGCLMRLCGHEEWKPLLVSLNDDGTKSATLREALQLYEKN